MECTTLASGGFESVLAESSRMVRVVSRVEALQELKQMAYDHGFVLKALPSNWTQHRPSQRQVEQENASQLSDARIWRTNTASKHDQQDNEEDDVNIVPHDDADTAALAMGTASLLASGSTSRSENPLEDLVRLPLRLILDTLQQLVLVDPIRAELVHERIRQLSTAMQEMKLPDDDERADA